MHVCMYVDIETYIPVNNKLMNARIVRKDMGFRKPP